MVYSWFSSLCKIRKQWSWDFKFYSYFFHPQTRRWQSKLSLEERMENFCNFCGFLKNRLWMKNCPLRWKIFLQAYPYRLLPSALGAKYSAPRKLQWEILLKLEEWCLATKRRWNLGGSWEAAARAAELWGSSAVRVAELCSRCGTGHCRAQTPSPDRNVLCAATIKNILSEAQQPACCTGYRSVGCLRPAWGNSPDTAFAW